MTDRWNTNLVPRLITALARLAPDPETARRFVAGAGVPTTQVNFVHRSGNLWFSILEEAEKHHLVERLLRTVREDYPEDPDLSDLESEVIAYHKDRRFNDAPRVSEDEMRAAIARAFPRVGHLENLLDRAYRRGLVGLPAIDRDPHKRPEERARVLFTWLGRDREKTVALFEAAVQEVPTSGTLGDILGRLKT